MELERVYNKNTNEKVNGLLGLDFLVEAGIIIDLVDLVIYTKEI